MTRLVSRVYGSGNVPKSDFEQYKPIRHKGKVVKWRKPTKSQYLPQHSPKDNTMELQGKRVKNKVKQIRPNPRAKASDYVNNHIVPETQKTHERKAIRDYEQWEKDITAGKSTDYLETHKPK